MTVATPNACAPVDYLLHLADNALILGQRNAEWCGHGPIIEEDLSMANNALDLIGQARLLYQYAAQLLGDGATEDGLAYFRDVPEFRNYTMLELPHSPPLAATARGDRDYATTIVRNFLYSALMVLLWERLTASADTQLAAIAARSLKEVRYHLRHSRDWLVRFGDGTDESHARAQAALDHLLPYTDEFWSDSAPEQAAFELAKGIALLRVEGKVDARIQSAVTDRLLALPTAFFKGFSSLRGLLRLHNQFWAFLPEFLVPLQVKDVFLDFFRVPASSHNFIGVFFQGLNP